MNIPDTDWQPLSCLDILAQWTIRCWRKGRFPNDLLDSLLPRCQRFPLIAGPSNNRDQSCETPFDDNGRCVAGHGPHGRTAYENRQRQPVAASITGSWTSPGGTARLPQTFRKTACREAAASQFRPSSPVTLKLAATGHVKVA